MTRIEKARVLTVVGYIVTLLIWAIGFGVVAALVGISPMVTGFVSFCVIFAFFMSPWYHQYVDWLEDLALLILKEKDV